jgi:replicative DNA helicase
MLSSRTTGKDAFMELVHTPDVLGGEYLEWARSRRDVPGVPFGIPAVDRKMIPAHPGDMIVVVGRPGHGKSSILACIGRQEAKRIKTRGADEVVVHVTFEQVVEEIEAVYQANDSYSVTDLAWGRVPIDDVARRSLSRAGLPIVIIGNSLARTNARSPRMYPETIFKAIESIPEVWGFKPSVLLFDYIQLIPIPAQADRQKQVIEAAHRVKEIAQRVGCPVFVAAQARREVDQRQNKIPGLWDAQWSSSIEQTADKYFSLWRPWLTEPHYDEFGQQNVVTIEGVQYPITQDLLVMSMLKQRFESGRWTWALHFAPQYLRLCEYELRKSIEEQELVVGRPDDLNF